MTITREERRAFKALAKQAMKDNRPLPDIAKDLVVASSMLAVTVFLWAIIIAMVVGTWRKVTG